MASSVVTISRTVNTVNDVTMTFTVGGTATFNTDYTVSGATSFNSTDGSLLIPAGQPSASFTISTVPDTDLEGDETIIITLNSNANWSLGSPSSTTVTILNDD